MREPVEHTGEQREMFQGTSIQLGETLAGDSSAGDSTAGDSSAGDGTAEVFL